MLSLLSQHNVVINSKFCNFDSSSLVKLNNQKRCTNIWLYVEKFWRMVFLSLFLLLLSWLFDTLDGWIDYVKKSAYMVLNLILVHSMCKHLKYIETQYLYFVYLFMLFVPFSYIEQQMALNWENPSVFILPYVHHSISILFILLKTIRSSFIYFFSFLCPVELVTFCFPWIYLFF